MPRKSLHILTLCVFLASASGAALNLHEALGGPGHHPEKCSVCQDLLTASKAITPIAANIAPSAVVVAVVTLPASQQPALPSLPTAIAPRAPPLA